LIKVAITELSPTARVETVGTMHWLVLPAHSPEEKYTSQRWENISCNCRICCGIITTRQR
jgi:hypothetical protein